MQMLISIRIRSSSMISDVEMAHEEVRRRSFFPFYPIPFIRHSPHAARRDIKY